MNDGSTDPLTVSRFVAVAAAGRHGSTEEIADCVADQLRTRLPRHWSVIRCSPADPLLEHADGIVLGSAIYLGQWMPSARTCLQALQQSGPEHIWLFSSGPVSDEQRGQRDHVVSPVDVPWRIHEHKVFGGRLDVGGLSNVERFLTRMVGARAGDRRDWAEIDEWADSIATQLLRAYAEDEAVRPAPFVDTGRRSPSSLPFAGSRNPRPIAMANTKGDPS